MWDQHVQLDVDRKKGVWAVVLPGALGTLNGQPLERAYLRNGDVMELGGAKIQFWLSPTRQKRFRFREPMTWLALAAISLGQIVLIYLLMR